MLEVSGAGSNARAAPTVPSVATARPCPGASSAVGALSAAPGSRSVSRRDCTATEPCSTDAVVWPESANATLNCVPRTLVTASGVRISMRRSGSALGGTVDSTPPLCISSTDCTLPARPRRRNWRSCSSDCACTRTTVPSASCTATNDSGPTFNSVPSSSLLPVAMGAGVLLPRACAVASPCTNCTVADSLGCSRTGMKINEPGCRRLGSATLLRACSSGHWRGLAR